MVNVIVAFPKAEVGKKIKGILVQYGFHVTHVVTSGAQVLAAARELDYGIVIAPAALGDLSYRELFPDLPFGFSLLLLQSKTRRINPEGERMHCLDQPIRVGALVREMEILSVQVSKRKKHLKNRPKKRSAEEKKIIADAKELLMQRYDWTEEAAHHYLQRNSMNYGLGLTETARQIIEKNGSCSER